MTEPYNSLRNTYGRARLDDRQVTELVGLARGLLADDFLSDDEIFFLRKWLAASEGVTNNPLLATFSQKLEQVLEDGIVDDEERADLFHFLKSLCANDVEIGEALQATSLPLCSPAPTLAFPGMRYCFTGSFVFGTRKDCEAAIMERGGEAGSLTKKTNFLVIGEYATDSWSQSSWGRKIEKAAKMRHEGTPIHIVSEQHWRSALD